MAELKIGRRFFDISEKDILLFNGACWQLMTQTYFDGWKSVYPTVSKTMCDKFAKKNILIHVATKDEYVTAEGKQFGLYYYKFDMDKLEEFLNLNKF